MLIDIMGIGIHNVTMSEALERAELLIAQKKAAICVTPNAEIVYDALKNDDLRQIISEAELVLPDGAGVVLASKILGTPLKEKVAGIEFAEALMARLKDTDKTFYFLGSKPGVAETAKEKLTAKYPGLKVVGTHDGYFTDEDAVVEEICRTAPDVLFVCLGAGKQECFMRDHKAQLPVGLMAGLGGSLDGFAGNVRRAPRWMIRCNLEWLYRFLQEPSRVGRVMRLPMFVLKVIGFKIRGGKEQ